MSSPICLGCLKAIDDPCGCLDCWLEERELIHEEARTIADHGHVEIPNVVMPGPSLRDRRIPGPTLRKRGL